MIQELSTHLSQYSASERRRIEQADAFAMAAHRGQKRKSGQPYISHPRAVAAYLMALNLDADTVLAGLLHDVVEDTNITAGDIEHHFGADVWPLSMPIQPRLSWLSDW
jgi:guanosine-3',5'-bis(diphosphate) 3'-pyrophosphohydrolase